MTDIEYQNQQLSLPEIEGVENLRLELIEKIRLIGETVVSQLVESYQHSSFSFEEISQFMNRQGHTRAEAGKVFTRFYDQLKVLDLEPPRNHSARKYEKNRDQYSYPLYLLSYVLDQVDSSVNERDIYQDLLYDFHTYKVDQLLVKKSTSA